MELFVFTVLLNGCGITLETDRDYGMRDFKILYSGRCRRKRGKLPDGFY